MTPEEVPPINTIVTMVTIGGPNAGYRLENCAVIGMDPERKYLRLKTSQGTVWENSLDTIRLELKEDIIKREHTTQHWKLVLTELEQQFPAKTLFQHSHTLSILSTQGAFVSLAPCKFNWFGGIEGDVITITFGNDDHRVLRFQLRKSS